MPVLLDVSRLTVARGRHTLLASIDWRVNRGEHWVVLGPNGSGKTTLLKALTGYLSATSGEISLLGRRYGDCDWRELREEIGVVTSAFAASIPAAESVLETIISGKFAQLDLWHPFSAGDRAVARRWARLLGLENIVGRPWTYLSQGERQRVLIARALMAKPKLLILDEPCAGLDPVARERFLTFLSRLARRRRGPALVLVTHHVEEIVPEFSHVLLLSEGRIAAAGERAAAMTQRNLTRAFGSPVRLARRRQRYQLTFPRL